MNRKLYIIFNWCNDYFLFLVTYELALEAEKTAVASSESENDRQSGKRKVKYNKHKQDYVDYVGPPRMVSSYKKSGDTSSSTSTAGKFFYLVASISYRSR